MAADVGKISNTTYAGYYKQEAEKVLSKNKRDDIVKALKDSYVYAHKAIDTITAANAFESLGKDKGTRAGTAAYCIAHSQDHYGQMVVYLRRNGVTAFNEPAVPIAPEITALTGITDEMVAGRRIDEAAISAFVDDAVIVIAHNSSFDRKFAERYWPIFQRKAWGCSATEVEWRKHGFEGSRLGYLLNGVGLFHQAHRAVDDCHALLELLALEHAPGMDLLQLDIHTVGQPSTHAVRGRAVGPDHDPPSARRGVRPEQRMRVRMLAANQRLQLTDGDAAHGVVVLRRRRCQRRDRCDGQAFGARLVRHFQGSARRPDSRSRQQ